MTETSSGAPATLHAAHAFRPTHRYTTLTVPNVVTLVRTVASTTLALLVLAGAFPDAVEPIATAVAFGVYWLGDVLDGFTARLLDAETRGGALLDTLCDRFCTCLCVAAAIVSFDPPLFPVLLYLLNFMLIDFWLSLRFVEYDIDTNNEFYKVNPLVYRLNWHPAAKALNSAGVALAAFFAPVWISMPFLLALIAVKCWSWTLLDPRPAAAVDVAAPLP